MESLSNYSRRTIRNGRQFLCAEREDVLSPLWTDNASDIRPHFTRRFEGFQSAGARMRARPELAYESEGGNRTVSFVPLLNLVIFRAFLMVRRGLVNQLPLSRVRTGDQLSYWMCVSSYTVLRLVVLVIFSVCSHKSAGQLWEARILSKGGLLFPSFSPSK